MPFLTRLCVRLLPNTHDRAMIMGGSPRLGFLGWEQGLEPLPLDVGQFASVHVASPPFQLESIARRDQSLQTRPSIVLRQKPFQVHAFWRRYCFYKPRTVNSQWIHAEGPIKTFTLRGIKDSPPYLHDGRLLTFEDTVEFFNLVLGVKLTAQEKKALVAFMRQL
jgi:hypothetical protein